MSGATSLYFCQDRGKRPGIRKKVNRENQGSGRRRGDLTASDVLLNDGAGIMHRSHRPEQCTNSFHALEG